MEPTDFPALALPIVPPYPPMEAKSARDLPTGAGWQFEPKWDGFRALCFRDGATLAIQSKSGQPLGRYFPELLAALAALPSSRFVLDAEILVPVGGVFSFDDLGQRIHPAKSRIEKLAAQTPATIVCFDLLVEGDRRLYEEPLSARRPALEAFFERELKGRARFDLSPATTDRERAAKWRAEIPTLDGIVAKKLELPYRSGERDGMSKVKWLRTADCVIGGFRYGQKGGALGSFLLGLYDAEGKLHHVGFSSSFKEAERPALLEKLLPHRGPPGFTGKAPGGPSRWSNERSTEWEPLDGTLVVEVQYDHWSQGRFRHGTTLLRFRPDKDPRACTLDQVEPKVP